MSSDKISVDIIDNGLRKLLENVAERESIHDYQIKTGKGSLKGDGYVGIINAVQVIGKDNEDKPKILNLVVKSATKSVALRNAMALHAVFKREIYVYKTILPTFNNLEVENGITPTRFGPKLYHEDTTEFQEALVLENLKECGYRLFERRIPMDDAHVSLVLKHYGLLHALTFALRSQKPEIFQKIASNLEDGFLQRMKDAKVTEGLLYRYKKALECLDPVADKKVLTKCETAMDDLDSFYDSIPAASDDYSVILHGDCWTNNMMFKYDDNNEPNKPTAVNLLDFQRVRVATPVLDLSYFFYSCSSKEVFNNYEHYLRIYYDSLATHLRKFQCDPEKLFPYSVLKEHWKKYVKSGLAMAACIIYVMVTEENEIVDVGDVPDLEKIAEAFTYEIANAEEYHNRMRPLIMHFIENNFI